MSAHIQLPAHNITQVMKLRMKLVEYAEPFYGQPVTAQNFADLVQAARRLLPGELDQEVLRKSLQNLWHLPLARKDWDAAAWRLAGNLPRLRQGLPAPLWGGQPEPEWVPLQIDRVERRVRKKDETPGAVLTFTALAGTPTGCKIERFWTVRFMRRIKQDMGFSRGHDASERVHQGKSWIVRNFPFRDSAEFVRLRLWGLFTPETCVSGKPGFMQIHTNSACREWNRKILVLRTRLEVPCPKGFSHPCHYCPIGYQECRAGCHRETYIYKTCAGCQREAWHDPENGDDAPCIACSRHCQ